MKIITYLLLSCFPFMSCQSKTTEPENESLMVFVDINAIVSTHPENPIGLNLNYFIDGDNVMPRQRPLKDAIVEMGVKWLRYPGGDKSDNNLFALPPYEKASPQLSRKGEGTSMGRGDFLVNDESSFRYDPFDFDEFMQLCNETGCEPIVVVPCDSYKNPYPNATSLTSRPKLIEHAAEWVRYANIIHNYSVKYWMIGNESWHDGVRWSYSAQDYALDVKEFSQAMKAIDPSILIIPNTANDVNGYTRTLFEKASGCFDALCISNYPIRGYKEGYKDYAWGQKDFIYPFTGVLEQIEQYAPGNQKEIPIMVAEYGPFDWWNGWGFDADMGHTMCNFEIMARLLQQPSMLASCFWNTRWLIEPNNWHGFNALDNDNNLHPIAYSVAFLARYLYPNMVKCQIQHAPVSAYASHSPSEEALYLYLVNKGGERCKMAVDVKDFKLTDIMRCASLSGKTSTDFSPKVDTTHQQVSAVELPPYSINVYKIELSTN